MLSRQFSVNINLQYTNSGISSSLLPLFQQYLFIIDHGFLYIAVLFHLYKVLMISVNILLNKTLQYFHVDMCLDITNVARVKKIL